MMFIVCTSGFIQFSPATTVVWHKGETLPVTREQIVYVQEVQADGAELELILYKFQNLPWVRAKSVQRWYGDLAKFIVGNLHA